MVLQGCCFRSTVSHLSKYMLAHFIYLQSGISFICRVMGPPCPLQVPPSPDSVTSDMQTWVKGLYMFHPVCSFASPPVFVPLLLICFLYRDPFKLTSGVESKHHITVFFLLGEFRLILMPKKFTF